MIARHLFAAHAASRAIWLARRVRRDGVTARVGGKVRAISLTWRRRTLGVFFLPRGAAPTGVTVQPETRLVMSQRQVETRWMTGAGRQGPAGEAGATGKAVPGLRYAEPVRAVGPSMIWATVNAGVLHRQLGGSTSRAHGASKQSNTAVVAPELRFLVTPGLPSARAQGASIGQPAKVSVSLQPQIGPLIVRHLLQRMTVATPARGGDAAAVQVWRKAPVAVIHPPQFAASSPSQSAEMTRPKPTPHPTELVWRKPEAVSGATAIPGGQTHAMSPRQRETVFADPSNLRRASTPTPTPEAERVPPGLKAVAAPTPFDPAGLAGLADEVIRRIDKRERIARERAGR